MISTNRMKKVLATLACATAMGASPLALAQQQHQQHGAAGSAQKDMKMDMDMKAMMKAHGDKMNGMQMSGKPDIDFAMMMRMHHQGAIEMSEAELKMGKEPAMKKMAREIIAAQKKEIAQLDRFLAKHGHTMGK